MAFSKPLARSLFKGIYIGDACGQNAGQNADKNANENAAIITLAMLTNDALTIRKNKKAKASGSTVAVAGILVLVTRHSA